MERSDKPEQSDYQAIFNVALSLCLSLPPGSQMRRTPQGWLIDTPNEFAATTIRNILPISPQARQNNNEPPCRRTTARPESYMVVVSENVLVCYFTNVVRGS